MSTTCRSTSKPHLEHEDIEVVHLARNEKKTCQRRVEQHLSHTLATKKLKLATGPACHARERSIPKKNVDMVVWSNSSNQEAHKTQTHVSTLCVEYYIGCVCAMPLPLCLPPRLRLPDAAFFFMGWPVHAQSLYLRPGIRRQRPNLP